MNPIENPIKIVSDGTLDGTFVYGPDGKIVEGVTRVTIDCNVADGRRPYVTATLTLLAPELEIVCNSVALANGSARKEEERWA